jgi:hypothetical protein
MEVDIWKRFPTLVVAEIPFDVKQNRCMNELRIIHIQAGEVRRLWMPDVDQIMETRHCGVKFLCFSRQKHGP